MLAGAAAILFVASAIQRITGMGLALVASPFLVLVLGSSVGVQVVQVVGLAVCGAAAWQLRRDCHRGKAGLLLASSLVGLVPGALLARAMSPAWLSVLIGGVTLLALVASLAVRRAPAFAGLATAGALSGFMNVTAGVGGPPLVIYANTTRWHHVEYVATVQLFFAAVNALSVAGRGWPPLPGPAWAAVAAASGAGLWTGHRLARHVSADALRWAVWGLAALGAAAALIRGLLSL